MKEIVSRHENSGWRRVALVAALCSAQACGICFDDDKSAPMEVANRTDYYLHVLYPAENILYLPPGERAWVEAEGSATVTVLIAPGQEVRGSANAYAECCVSGDKADCSAISISERQQSQSYAGSGPYAGNGSYPETSDDAGVEPENTGSDESNAVPIQDVSLYASTSGPNCDEGGSCPYVYAHDGRGFVLEGETLVGALNQGARRSEAMVLPSLRPERGQYRIRLATELEEINYLDAVGLEIVRHRPGVRVVGDGQENLYGITDTISPLRAVDAKGIDRIAAVLRDDGKYWEAVHRDTKLAGKIRDWLVLDFPRPKAAKRAKLVVRGRNTALSQEAYHAYIRQFGPGFPRLLRVTTSWPWYRPTLEGLLKDAGFSIGLAVREAGRWTPAGSIGPVGPAGIQSRALDLALPAEPASRLRVRVAVLPGSWLLDSVQVSYEERQPIEGRLLEPVDARYEPPEGAAREIDFATLRRVDGDSQAVPTGAAVELWFLEPPLAEGMGRTAVLRVTGYYEENARSVRPCVRFEKLYDSCLQDNAFARFVLKKLEWQDVVDRYLDEAGLERIR